MNRNVHNNIMALAWRITGLTVIVSMAAVVIPAADSVADSVPSDSVQNDVVVQRADNGLVEEQTVELRDPFWPVGYEPPRPEEEGEEPDEPDEPDEPEEPEIEPPTWDAAVERLQFQGRFEGRGRIMASVNGQIVEEGSVIGVRLPPYVYYWRITAIHHSGIETEPVDAIPIE